MSDSRVSEDGADVESAPRAGVVDWSIIRGWFARNWLGVWFGVVLGLSLREIPANAVVFGDAQIYLAATRAWLHGGDPWSVPVNHLTFAGPPTMLIPLVPFALLPPDIGVAALAIACVAGAITSVRMLRLPWWWLMFPPVAVGLVTANVQLLLIPLILAGWGWLAIFVKVYAAVPLLILGQWRQLAIAAVVMAVTIPILPWGEFVARFSAITSTLNDQSNASIPTMVLVLLAPIGLLALVVIGRERAAWLAVPALWPSQQPYYATFAMPARSSIAAAIIAFPITGAPLIAVVVLAALAIAERAMERAGIRQRRTNVGPGEPAT